MSICRVIKPSVDRCLMKYRCIGGGGVEGGFGGDMKEDQKDGSLSYFSMCPPFAFAARLALSGAWLRGAHVVSPEITSQRILNLCRA